MSNIKLSATRVNTFLKCKQKYWFSYVKKMPKMSNPSFKLGIAVHESLELAGKIWLERGKFEKNDIEKVLNFYDEISVKEGIEDHGVHLEGKDLVKARLKNFISGKKLISLETKFGFGDKNEITTCDGVPLMGAIDKVEEINKDTLLIVDYKTSKTTPTGEELRTDIQLSIYDFVARKLWPGYKRVILSLDMLKGDIVFTYRTDAEREAFEKYLGVVYKSMVNFTENDAKPNIHLFCPWCDFRDYCDAYKKACNKADYNFVTAVNMSNDGVMAEWMSVRDTKKILENREKELSMVITENIKKNGTNFIAGGKEVYLRQNSRTSYDLEAVHRCVPGEDFPRLVKIDSTAVKKYLDVNPEVKGRILDTAEKSYTSAFLAVRNLK